MTVQGLYIMFEGLPESVIDSQVMLHASEMRELGIIDFEIWTFVHSRQMDSRMEGRLREAKALSGSTVKVFHGVKPAIPFSELLNAALVMAKLAQERLSFEVIHARTDYTAAVCGWLSLIKEMSVVWDCRGDSEAEIRASLPDAGIVAKNFGWYRILLARWRAVWAARTCSKAIFVSDKLRQRREKYLGEKPSVVIPGVASDRVFFFDQLLRDRIRANLEYSTKDRILVYSGSLAPYQCFPETVHMFRKLRSEHEDLQLLVVTPDTNRAMGYLSNLPHQSYKLVSARHEDVNGYLNAADFAVMLRSHSPVNNVAFPTKFAEYGLAGLPVIMGDSVPECFAIALRIGNLIDVEGADLTLKQADDRERVSTAYQSQLTRSAMVSRYRQLYSPA
jgi:glycosyltransferase involved in cell wall biosynthesis